MIATLWNKKFVLALGFVFGGTPTVWSLNADNPRPGFVQTSGTASNDAAIADTGGATASLETVEKRLQTAYKLVSPAIVEIFYGNDNRSAGTGVIVSGEGHVIASSSASWRVIDESLLKIRLSDGRLVNGKALGWSNEWAIGMLKINLQGPLPFVELGNGSTLAAGDLCVALGYQNLTGVERDKRPTLRLGAITHSSGTDWFRSSCDMFAGGYSVFNLDGKLIGLTKDMFGLHTNVEKIRKYWDELIAGKNMDRESTKRTGAELETDKSKKEDSKAQLQEEKDRIAAMIEKLKLATVKIGGELKFSGVIVSADGYVITCAHHSGLPGNEVRVSLSDGREANAVILSSNKISDAGLIRITDEGPWPFAPLGDSLSLRFGDPCIKIGYPVTRRGQKLTVALSQIARQTDSIPRRDAYSSVLFFTKVSSEMTRGASGGGVFDMQGRVVGVILGTSHVQDRHLRAELFRKRWAALSEGKPVDVLAGEPMTEITAEFRRISTGLRRGTVKILCDGKQRAVGTIVGSDGLILTKLSELRGALSCKLVDRRVFPATIQKESYEHDLAVLKIEATGLPAFQWTDNQESVPGTLVAAVLPGQQSKAGVICIAARPSPIAFGDLGALLEKGDAGPTVSEIRMSGLGVPLQKGDVVLRIDGNLVPNIEAYEELRQLKEGIGAAGQEICVDVSRAGKQLTLRYRLVPTDPLGSVNLSRRWWGFSRVSGTDIRLRPRQCGSPLVDRHGHAVGILIACRSNSEGWGLRHVIPAQIVKALIQE